MRLIQYLILFLLFSYTQSAGAKDSQSFAPGNINFPLLTEIIHTDTIETIINASICFGQSYEGYSAEGTYTDHFVTASGDDSVRILHLAIVSCCKANSGVYGSSGELENGLSIAASPDNNSYYVAGIRADSVMLMKFDINDELLWSFVLDAVGGINDYPVGIIVDSDGMLVVAGMATNDPARGGSAFILRFDPNTLALLWSREIHSTAEVDRVHGLSQNGTSGNYLLTTNPLDFSASRNYAQVIEIDKLTGLPTQPQVVNYILANSAYVFDLTRDGGFLYGTGRYTMGASNSLQRYAILKFDANTLEEVWTYLGHKRANSDARMYGFDLVIDGGFMYCGIYGDPDGSTTTESRIFIQKSTLDGEVVWLKEYDTPLNTDVGYEMIKSGNDLALLTSHRGENGKLYLFKVNTDGDVIWSKQFGGSNINTGTFNLGGNQLISLDEDLIFIATADDLNGERDMVVIHTDSTGKSKGLCFTDQVITINVRDIPDPEFFPITSLETVKTLSSQGHTSALRNITIPQKCITFEDTSQLEVSICQGDFFENYNVAGVYQDTFETIEGCDSLRILTLNVGFTIVNENITMCSGGNYEGYTEPGFYIDTIQGLNGECDTLRFIQLAFDPPIQSSVKATICIGQTYLGYQDTGIYTDTFATMSGCDSVRILELTVSVIQSTAAVIVCAGEIFEGYSESGIYTDTFITQVGCDSVRTLNLFVQEPNLTSISTSICYGEILEGYTESGVYVDTFLTNNGCDSIRTILLTTIPTVHTEIHASGCDINAPPDLSPGIYIDTLLSKNGCDSVRTLHLSGAQVYVPNVFSPNLDGTNDVFTITVFPEQDFNVEYFAIFDRLGNMVYETSDWPITWDGINRMGKSFQPGVFAYIFIYRCGGKQLIEHGDITVLK